MNRTLVIFLIALVLLTACGTPATPAPASQATATPQAKPAPTFSKPLVAAVKPGKWQGAGDNGFIIAFTVSDDGAAVVNGLQFTFHATCGSRASNITDTLSATERIGLQAGQFKFIDANYSLIAGAVAADRIEGMFQAEGVSLGKLGQCGTSSIAWTASPQ